MTRGDEQVGSSPRFSSLCNSRYTGGSKSKTRQRGSTIPHLNGDPTVSRIRSLTNLASLIPDLTIMVQLDLVMMDLELEVAIRDHAGGVGWHYSVVRAEGEGEFGVEY